MSRFLSVLPRPILVAAAVVALTAGTAAAQTTIGPGGGGMVPGGDGKLTGRSGSTLQLEGRAGASKVLVTGSTDYRKVEATDASAITVGACVRVTGNGSADDGIAATAVSVVDDDACAAPRTVAPGGASRDELPDGGSLPDGAARPNGGTIVNGGSLPDGGSLPAGGFTVPGGMVTGVVKQVDGTTIVVKGRVPQPSTNGGGRIALKKQKVTVTLAETATVTHTVAATESALTVGSCVSAQGTADSVGTVTAATVTVSEAVDGQCTGGFGGPGVVTFSGPT